MPGVLTYIAIIAYALFSLFILWGWWKVIFSSKKSKKNNNTGTVIIPFRNEENRLSPLIISIKNLIVKFRDIEFIFVDDHSDDYSASLLEKEFAGFSNIKIVHLPLQVSGKKAAISYGISIAKFSNIITMDADCELTESALNSMLYFLENPNIKMVCGVISQYSGKGFAARLADLEFLSLIGSGISFWGTGIPFMANGAFLGFKKEAFLSVDGFKENEQFPGGDDVFLLQKIRLKYGKMSIHFLSQSDDLIITKGDGSLREFMHRRVRWGAKAKAYTSLWARVISISVFLINVLYIATILSLIYWQEWIMILYLCGIKLLLDILTLSPIIMRLKKWELLPYILPASFIHPFYILLSGFISMTGKYSWKTRKYG